MVISAAFGWDLMSFDVETAFLNGIALARELYCWPPNDVKNIDPKKLWRLKKGVFGLTEALRLWWLRIRGDLLACGWTEVKAAAATFILKDPKGNCAEFWYFMLMMACSVQKAVTTRRL